MKNLIKLFPLFAVVLFSVTLFSCGGDDDDEPSSSSQLWDVLQVNSENYACYGKRSYITFSSEWNSSNGMARIALPYGKLSDAQKGEYDIDELFAIRLIKTQPLQKGDNLGDYSPIFTDEATLSLEYVSGSAIVIAKKDDDYITIKFNSFKFGNSSTSYTLNGTVQLDLDED